MPTYPIAPTSATANLPAPPAASSSPHPIAIDALRTQVDEMIRECAALKTQISAETTSSSTVTFFASRLQDITKRAFTLRAELENADPNLARGAEAVRAHLARDLNMLERAIAGDQGALQGIAEVQAQDASRPKRFLLGAGVSFVLSLGAILTAVYCSEKSKGLKGLRKPKRPKFKRALAARG